MQFAKRNKTRFQPGDSHGALKRTLPLLPSHLPVPLVHWVEHSSVQVLELPGHAARKLGDLMSE